ncbi:DUF1993 domain-containing protein [Lichenihabitans psoromatis]|uniref:DUF1993 domain-containing protein n=1 Tax=Lichenihabitans psoromatis TaxID=2528642 RepID=UPI0010355D4A|nr:DUF1993 domain-containing protein [Lichenihabitans psoromatis]
MPLSMHDLSVPVFVRALHNLSAILDKGVTFAASEGVSADTLTGGRLIGDMGPLTAQIQRASDTAKGCVARLAGITVPSFADTETTFPELQKRITDTIELLQSIAPSQIDGSEDRSIDLKFGERRLTMTGRDYLLGFVLPNFFFHVTTAYAILRHKGVPVGKMDFLGLS